MIEISTAQEALRFTPMVLLGAEVQRFWHPTLIDPITAD
jgi:hypothetical protein